MLNSPSTETQLTLIIHSELSPELVAIKQEFGARNFTIDEVGNPGWAEEMKEWFWKDPDIHVFAYTNDELVGLASFTKREVQYNAQLLKIAGLGGLTVAKEHRGQGIAKMLIEKRLKLAKEWGADIAFLNTDIDKLGSLFAKYGFVPLGKDYSFIGKTGEIHQDDSGMIAPVLSEEKFRQALDSPEPLFIGESNI